MVLQLAQNRKANMDRIRILNVEIDNVSMEELLAQLKRGVLVTPNVDQMVKM